MIPPLFEINIRHVLIWTGLGPMGLDKKLSTYGWVYKGQEDPSAQDCLRRFCLFPFGPGPNLAGPLERKIGNQSLGSHGTHQRWGILDTCVGCAERPLGFTIFLQAHAAYLHTLMCNLREMVIAMRRYFLTLGLEESG
jgi:hypothetical protein